MPFSFTIRDSKVFVVSDYSSYTLPPSISISRFRKSTSDQRREIPSDVRSPVKNIICTKFRTC